MNTTPNENNENLELENVATAEAEEVVEEIIEETATEVAQEEIIEEAPTEAEEAEEIAEEAVEVIADADDAEAPAEAEEAVSVVLEDEEEPKKKSKAFAFTGLIALVVVCAFLWVMYSGIFAPKYAPTYDNSENTAFYIVGDTIKGRKDNGAIYTAVPNTLIADEGSMQYPMTDVLEGITMRTPDGTALFQYKNFDLSTYKGDLYVSYKDKTPELIDTGVSTALFASSDGKVAVYAKAESIDNELKISYFLHRKGKAPVMFAENASQNFVPALSLTAQYIAYAIDNAETQKTELYVVKTTDRTLKPVKVADSIVALHCVKDNGYAFYSDLITTEDGTQKYALYYASPKKGSTMIAEDAMASEAFISQYSNNFAYYSSLADGATEFFTRKIGKNSKTIFTSASQFKYKIDAENNNFLFIVPNDNNPELLDFHVVRGNKHEVMASETAADTLSFSQISRDYNKLIYLKNYDSTKTCGELYLAERKFGVTKTKKIADNVFYTSASEDLDYILYFTDVDMQTGIGTMNIYDGRKSTKVAENVLTAKFEKKDQKLFYLTKLDDNFKTATLNVINPKNPTKNFVVDQEISLTGQSSDFSSRDDGSVYYMKNFDSATQTGDLFFAKNNKTGTLVESGVSKLIFE